ncbi:hypothetical protein [Spongorhabdus nitratireducens]
MIVLDELIKETESKKLDDTLKKAFSALADPVVIDKRERETLLFLVNRTIRGNKKFFDKSSLGLLKDESWRNDLLKVTQWIHTHNLKYPYSKADGCIFYYEQPLRLRKTKILGYAKDAKQINKCQFLITEFFWRGSVTSLAEQFAFYYEDDYSLVDQLLELGLPEGCIPVFQKRCSEALKVRLPDSVHQHCKQVRFLVEDGQPIAVTPVVSTGTQQLIHKLTKEPEIYGATVFHNRPSALGSFVSACAGRVRCLNYPPRLGNQDRSTDDLIRQWRYRHHLLNESALFNKQAINLLFDILRENKCFSTYQALKKRREERKRCLQKLFRELFADILLLRSRSLSQYPKLSREIHGSIEKGVITGDFDHEQVSSHFTRQIHELLERSNFSQDLAYQPVLLKAITNGIRSFFSGKNTGKPTENYIYIHFERLLAYGANCQASPYLIGLPSLTAFAGLVDAFLLKLGVIEQKAFAIVLRRFARRLGHPLAKQTSKNQIVRNDTVIDSQHCDIEFDLVVRLDKRSENFDCSIRNLYRCIPRRFAGGVLSYPILGTYQKLLLFRRCNVYRSSEEFFNGLRLLPSFTRFIGGVGSGLRNQNLNDLHDILKKLSVLPVNSGFRFLGGLCHREGAIADLHAYGEHIHCLVELNTPASVLTFSEIRKQIFWNIHISEFAIEICSGVSHD